jgi:hypothetical protein
VDPGLIAGHAEVVSVAEQLGYDPMAFYENRLRLRYVGA